MKKKTTNELLEEISKKLDILNERDCSLRLPIFATSVCDNCGMILFPNQNHACTGTGRYYTTG